MSTTYQIETLNRYTPDCSQWEPVENGACATADEAVAAIASLRETDPATWADAELRVVVRA